MPITKKRKTETEGEVDRVYRLLHEWLVTAKIAPGEFLSEPDLAARCRTSRTPVREACSRLAQDKWLTLIRRKGYLVKTISVRDIFELYEYRRLLETFTAEHTAQSAGREQIRMLREILAVEGSENATLPEILEANERFHLALAEITGNRRVVDQLTLTLSYVKRLDTLCTQSVPGWVGHREIMDAIENHLPADAARAMAQHIEISRDKMIRLFAS